MTEGFYWIQHNGRVQVAYYTNEVTDDLETGQTITGVWHLTQETLFVITVKLKFCQSGCFHQGDCLRLRLAAMPDS